MFYVCVLWDKAVIDTTLKASFRLRSEDYTTCLAEQHFLLLTPEILKPAPNVFIAMCMYL